MNTRLIALFSETPIHVGSGEATGFLDLPVAREAATDYPVVPGSGLKGALRDLARSHGCADSDLEDVFGHPDGAGGLLVSDARLLLLPVRSLHGAFRWVTCGHLLERLERDTRRAGTAVGGIIPQDLQPGGYNGSGPKQLFLEERQFTRSGDVPRAVLNALEPLFFHESTRARLGERLVILHDDDFAWFARYGLMVSARNKLDEEKKTSENLWYEETVPPDTLFTTLVAERRKETDALARLLGLFEEKPYLQVGGNETIGQGIFAIKVTANGGGAG